MKGAERASQQGGDDALGVYTGQVLRHNLYAGYTFGVGPVTDSIWDAYRTGKWENAQQVTGANFAIVGPVGTFGRVAGLYPTRSGPLAPLLRAGGARVPRPRLTRPARQPAPNTPNRQIDLWGAQNNAAPAGNPNAAGSTGRNIAAISGPGRTRLGTWNIGPAQRQALAELARRNRFRGGVLPGQGGAVAPKLPPGYTYRLDNGNLVVARNPGHGMLPPLHLRNGQLVHGRAPAGNAAIASSQQARYIPTDSSGNPIPLRVQTISGQDLPLPDPLAGTRAHTVIGGRVGSDGNLYRQAAQFPVGRTQPSANGQSVPWSRIDWTNHGRPWDHPAPHHHPITYDWNNGYYVVEPPRPFVFPLGN